METSKPIALTAAGHPRIAGNCVVTSTANSGAGTLRWCLENAESGTTITFEPSVFPPTSPVSITLQSPLPTILQGDITIDGSDAGVILDGKSSGGNGLEIFSDGNVVRGLQILNFPGHGVSIAYCKDNIIGGDRAQGAGPTGQGNVISGSGGNGVDLSESSTMSNTIIGNLIGTDVSGRNVLANQGHGVEVNLGASHNRIGGTDPRDRNIISGNFVGGINVRRQSHSNLIIGNYVGTDISGTTALGAGGIGAGGFNNRVEGNLVSGNPDTEVAVGDYGGCCNVVAGNLIGTDASGSQAIANGTGGTGVSSGGVYNRVGGTTPAERNVVSGKDYGIDVSGAGSVGMLVIGNLIGTDITGTQSIGNARTGVLLAYGSRAVVGGATPAERNVISGSGRQGIEVASDYNFILGNYIGTDTSGSVALGNRGTGIRVVTYLGGAEHNIIQGNLIAHTAFSFSGQEYDGVGVVVDSYPYNTLRRNSIYGNAGKGIETVNGGNEMLPAPVITAVTETSVSGAACADCTVELFSDEEDEGRVYEGNAIADRSGNWTWDGNPSGPYVTATATDQAGNTSAFSAPRIAWRPVQVTFTASPTSGFAPLTVVFTNTSTGGYTTSLWDFGDGITGTQGNPIHTYDLPDAYTVTLTVSGSGGADAFTRTNYIIVYEPVTADFTANPRYGVAPLTIRFADASSGPVAAWEWNFGDGGISLLQHPAHTYTAAGVYTVGLTARAAGGSALWPGGADTLTRTHFITIYEPVQAAFTATPTAGVAPLTVAFTNLSTGDYTTSIWDFGDEATSTLESPSHTYTAVGVYTITLTVSGPGGSDTEVKVGYISTRPPPGLIIQGHVWRNREGGPGLANVAIYRGFAHYPGVLVAITDQDGYYQSDFVYIPGDEMITVWAELGGYTFNPAMYYWRHYAGYKVATRDFIAIPKIYLPLVLRSG